MATIDHSLLWVAQIGAPRLDPAFDRRHKAWDRLETRYRRTRLARDLEALPTKPDKRPRLWGVSMLDPIAYRVLLAASDADRAQIAFTLGCLVRREPDGTEVRATLLPRQAKATTDQADLEWVRDAQRLGGMQVIAEVAEVIVRRAEIGDYDPGDEEADEVSDPLARYALPPGLLPSR